VIGVSADGMDGLLEADFDFEALMTTLELCRVDDVGRRSFC